MLILNKTQINKDVIVNSICYNNIGMMQLCREQNIVQLVATTLAAHLHPMRQIFADAGT